MECTGFERNIGECETEEIPEESGRELYKFIDIAGVSCLRVKPLANTETHTVQDQDPGMLIGLVFILVLFGIALAVIFG